MFYLEITSRFGRDNDRRGGGGGGGGFGRNRDDYFSPQAEKVGEKWPKISK